MISNQNTPLHPEFESVKDADERIYWVGRPEFLPFIVSEAGQGFFLLLVSAISIASSLNNKESPGFWWLIGLLPLGFGIYMFAKKILSYKNTCYGYSNKHVMMRTGVIGTTFKVINYNKIAEMEVTVNPIEKAYHVGSIKFFSGQTESDEGNVRKIYDRWEAIPNPYEIFKKVKQISADVKSDHN